ncbi:MAG: hypothetical protein PVH82_11675 [Desulfobacteraceae bacterium]
MERRRKIFLIGVVAVSLAFLAYALPGLAAEKRAGGQEVTIMGKLVKKATVMDEDALIYAVYIQTDNQGDYEVIPKGKGKELGRMLNKKVEATGQLTERKGKKYITVTAFRMVE